MRCGGPATQPAARCLPSATTHPSDTVIASYPQLCTTTNYLYGRDRLAAVASGTRTWYATDALGSVRHIAETLTGESRDYAVPSHLQRFLDKDTFTPEVYDYLVGEFYQAWKLSNA